MFWRWILLLEPGAHHFWHSRLWSVPSKVCCFSTETHRLLLRSQASLEIWVKASKIFRFFYPEVVPGFADEGRQILLLL